MVDLWFPYDPRGALDYFETRERYTTGPAEVRSALEDKQPIHLIDVRARADYERGHIPGAISLPKDQWESRAGLAHEQANVIYCYTEVCQLSVRAAIEFARAGFPVRVLEGGMKAWREYGYEITEPSAVAEDLGRSEAPPCPIDQFTETRMVSRHSSSWPHS